MRGERDVVNVVEGNGDSTVRLVVAWINGKHVRGQRTSNIRQPDRDLLGKPRSSRCGGLNTCQNHLHTA